MRYLRIVAAIVPMGLFAWAKTNSLGWTAVAVVALGAGLAGLLWFLRSEVTAEVRVAVQTGRIDISTFLDTASLPGRWPIDARRTMGLARNNAPAMPVQLTADDEVLYLRKTKYGRHPFTAKIALRDVADVTVSDASVMPIGATLHVNLRDDTEVRFHLHLADVDAAELAKLLRDRIPAEPGTEPPAGIVITSPAP